MMRVGSQLGVCLVSAASIGCNNPPLMKGPDAGVVTPNGETATAVAQDCGDTQTSVMNCGRCGHACLLAIPLDGTPVCVMGACGFACNEGFSPVEGTCVSIKPPRAIAPLSTSTVTSRRPTFTVALASGTDGARIEVFRDRAATMMVTAFDTTGSRGAPPADLPTGTLFWHARGRTGTRIGTVTSPKWQLVVGQRSANIDTAWGTMSDVNGDGYADVVIGTLVRSRPGQVTVYHGSATGTRSLPNTTLMAPTTDMDSQFGRSVATAGDVNGDGFADVIVGAPGEQGDAGRAYLYWGTAEGLAQKPAISIVGPGMAKGRFGAAVTAAGDVNGDGYADVAIGAPGIGRAFVYLGQIDLLETTPTATVPRQGTLSGDSSPTDEFGTSLAGACDVTGDGLADLVIGAPGSNQGTGSVHIFTGRKTGLDFLATTTLRGSTDGGHFGGAVACAGDTDGDGYSDVAVGQPGTGNPSSCLGSAPDSVVLGMVHVYRGRASDSLLSPTSFGPSSTPTNFRACGFGQTIATAGDINADGYSDLAVGAPAAWYGPNPYVGMSQLFMGGESGIQTTAVQVVTPTSIMHLWRFGVTVRGVGDINGDGFADLTIGTSGGLNEYVLVLLGSKSIPPFALGAATTLHTGEAFGTSIALLFRPSSPALAWPIPPV